MDPDEGYGSDIEIDDRAGDVVMATDVLYIFVDNKTYGIVGMKTMEGNLEHLRDATSKLGNNISTCAFTLNGEEIPQNRESQIPFKLRKIHSNMALNITSWRLKLETGFRAGPVTVSTSECDVRTLEQETRASIWSTDMRQLPLFKLAAVYAYFITRVHLALQQMNNSALFVETDGRYLLTGTLSEEDTELHQVCHLDGMTPKLLRPDFNKFDLEGFKTDLRKVSAELEMDDHDNHVEWRKCLKRREELEEKWSTQRPRTTWPLKQLIKRISELKRNTPGPATQPRHTTELLRARREAEQVELGLPRSDSPHVPDSDFQSVPLSHQARDVGSSEC
ncbi:hypothetical protein Bbelb_048580 [Branchiostoma belcheri]|nr:hypothetical protein Bbelb_048580 [Branchiostoma belcheri]